MNNDIDGIGGCWGRVTLGVTNHGFTLDAGDNAFWNINSEVTKKIASCNTWIDLLSEWYYHLSFNGSLTLAGVETL